MSRRIVLRAAWVIACRGGCHVALPDHAVVVEGDRIADVTTVPPADAIQLDMPGGVVLPGMINLHNHTLNAPVFRSIVDDLPRGGVGPSKVYSMLMPIGGLAVTALSPKELGDLVALGLLEVARSGATTLVDQFRPRQAMILDLAREMGLRFYGAPYLFSPSDTKTDAEVARAARGSFEGASGLASFRDLHARHDGGEAGRLRVILGPHAADSCDPDLLQEADRLSRELDTLTMIHAAQSRGEVDRVRERHGVDVATYLARNGLLRPRVILAHGVFFSDDELARVAASGAGLANCANVFIRGGTAAPFERFTAAGVRTGIGTDAERMDMFAQMQVTGFASKQAMGRGDAATAAKLLHAATIGGADILGRSDLGRIERGAKADLLMVDLMKPHLQPVRDPIRSLVWYASAQDIDTVMIDGAIVLRAGRFLRGDEAMIVARGATAGSKLWALADARGMLPEALKRA